MKRVPFLSIVLFCSLLTACQEDSSVDNAAGPKNTAGIDTLTGLPMRGLNPWKNAGCELITDAEVSSLFGFNPKEATLNTRTLPDQGFCLRTWNKPDWKERENNNEKPDTPQLEPRNTLVVQVLDYGQKEVADAQIAMIKRDRRDTYEEDIKGLGDDAVWSTNTRTLLVQKGHLVVNITLEYFDQPHDNLAKAKELAAIALKKM